MYAKLFSSITESSLWSEPKEVRLLFVTMLAKADQTGFVEASVPGLARVANLSIDETVQALDVLKSPDKFSKNPDNEGRRIIDAPGGFMLLNYEDYRSRRNTEERQAYMREYMKEYRKSKQCVNNSKQELTAVKRCEPQLSQAEAEAEAEAEETKRKRVRFIAPSVDDVRAYAYGAKLNMDCDLFHDHYTANGWKQGGGKPIKDWKAACRVWNRRQSEFSKQQQPESRYGDL